MKKNYNLIYLFVLVDFVDFMAAATEQTIGDVQWEDLFDDAENAFFLNHGGWL